MRLYSTCPMASISHRERKDPGPGARTPGAAVTDEQDQNLPDITWYPSLNPMGTRSAFEAASTAP
jgi:hypothetical protein